MRVVLGRHDAVEDIDNIQLRHGGNLRPDRFFRNGDLLAFAQRLDLSLGELSLHLGQDLRLK